MKMVGEVVKFNDEWYQYVNGDKCKNCDLRNHCIKNEPVSTCGKSDCLVFKKLDKVEEGLKLCEDFSCDKYLLAIHGPVSPIYNGNEALFFTESFMYCLNGNHALDGLKSDLDLMIAQSRHSGWMNIYKTNDNDFAAVAGSAYLFKTEEEAKNSANSEVIATVEVKWKE